MNEEDWDSGFGKAIGVYLNGDGIRDRDQRGQLVKDDSFIMLFDAHHEAIEFDLPPEQFGPACTPIIDTAVNSGAPPNNNVLDFGASVKVEARSLAVLGAGSPSSTD